MQRNVWYKLYIALLLYTPFMMALNIYLWQFDIVFLQTGSISFISFLICYFVFDAGIGLKIAIFLTILMVIAIVFLLLKKVFTPIMILYFVDFILALFHGFIISFAPKYMISLVFYASAIVIVIMASKEKKSKTGTAFALTKTE